MLPSFIKFQGPGPNARVVYIDGAFDLFHAGHVEVWLVVSTTCDLCWFTFDKIAYYYCQNSFIYVLG